jgi:hypothetical protein
MAKRFDSSGSHLNRWRLVSGPSWIGSKSMNVKQKDMMIKSTAIAIAKMLIDREIVLVKNGMFTPEPYFDTDLFNKLARIIRRAGDVFGLTPTMKAALTLNVKKMDCDKATKILKEDSPEDILPVNANALTYEQLDCKIREGFFDATGGRMTRGSKAHAAFSLMLR